MPTDYQCEACNLAIQIGWYHYHSASEGYWSAQLGFCQKCGTIHQLESGAGDGPLPNRMFAQPGPLQIGEAVMPGVPYHIPKEKWRALADRQLCGHCGAASELLFGTIKETPAVSICPRCRSSRMKKLFTWMT